MTFKSDDFEKAKMDPRTAAVSVPGLSDWFDGDPVWDVRGLTGNELGRCNEMIESRKTLTEILQGLLAKKTDETADEYVPRENALWMEYLMIGSVNPKCSLPMAVKLNDAFPVEFRIITRKILELTGLGAAVGKQMPSGTIQTSEPA